jgi:hypothetical protein
MSVHVVMISEYDNLMLRMVGDVIPLVTQPTIGYLKKRNWEPGSDTVRWRFHGALESCWMVVN